MNENHEAIEASRREVEAAIAGTDVDEINRVCVKLAAEKRSIELQLAEDKSAMMTDRSRRIHEGMNPREAVIRTSAETDFDWRGRAVAALKHIEGRLQRLRSRLKALRAANPGADYVVEGYAGDVASVAEAITNKIAEGYRPHATVSLADGAVVIYTLIRG